ncbi:MAG: condensation domain-containing protein, partial [Planctomycetota bacterium]
MGSAPNVEGIHRLTPTQEGILFHAVQGEQEGLYVQQFTCVLVGDLDVERFRTAWQATVDRHPGLRSLFTWKKRPHPLQVVRRSVEVDLEVFDDAAIADGGDALESWLREDRSRGIEIDQTPLFRLRLVRGSDVHRTRLLWTFHHISLDGWSMRIALHEALRNYAGPVLASPPPAPTPESYVKWLASCSLETSLEHWRGVLEGFDSPNEFFGVAGSTATAPDHVTLVRRLDATRTAAITQAARSAGVTLNALMRLAWSIAIARVSGERDVVFGATVSGRPPEFPEIEDLVGMCIHTVPVRARLDPAAGARDACRGLQGDQLDGLPHETTSLAEIQRASEIGSGESLFHSILVMENHAAPPAMPAGGLTIEDARYEEKSHDPLALLVVPDPEALELLLVHDRGRVTDSEASDLLNAVERTLGRIADEEDVSIGGLLELSEAEIQTLDGWRRAAATAADDQASPEHADDVVNAFLRAARKTPDGTALRCVGSDPAAWTYAELERASARVSSELARRGIQPGNRVAVRLERGHAAIAVILGILRAEAAYVPMDPEAPESRVEAMLATSGARLLIGTGGESPRTFLSAPIDANEEPPAEAT